MYKKLPKGKYIISDPCYALDDKVYDEMLKHCFQDKSGITDYELDGKRMIILEVPNGGSGEYRTFDRGLSASKPLLPLIPLCSDSGLLAIIPMELICYEIDDFDERVYNIIEAIDDIEIGYVGVGLEILGMEFGAVYVDVAPKNEYDFDFDYDKKRGYDDDYFG